MLIHPAGPDDAEALSQVLRALAAAGKRRWPSGPDFARDNYIDHPQRISCLLARAPDGRVLGFQSLRLATSGNPYGTPLGWGIVGTHIRPDAARRGVGRELFRETAAAARQAGLPAIEAFISATNAEGLAYYGAMGFTDHRHADGAVAKRYDPN